MSKRIDLAVPFVEKEEVKKFHAMYDIEKGVWWTTEAFMCEGLKRWLPFQPTPQEVIDSLHPSFISTEEEREHVKLHAQTCEFPEWMLLMLPGSRWAAFLRTDLETRAASAVVEGNYTEGCRYVSSEPADVLDFMRENRIYQGELQEPDNGWSSEPADYEEFDDSTLYSTGHLTVGNHTLEIQLPSSCANLIAHLPDNVPVPTKNSALSKAVFTYLDRYTPISVKPPLGNQLDLARRISQQLRVPISTLQLENRSACLDFIDQHKADLTMYRAIFKELTKESRDLAKRINSYVRWSTAKTLLLNDVPWEAIAESLGVKTRATVEKYAVQATEAEEEMPELLSASFYQDLIQLGRNGGSVDLALREIVEAKTWEIFSRERLVRAALRTQSAS